MIHWYSFQRSAKDGQALFRLQITRSEGQELLALIVSRKKRRAKKIYVPLSWPLYKITASSLNDYPIPLNWRKLFVPRHGRASRAMDVYLLGGSITILIIVVIGIVIVVPKVRSAERRKMLEQILVERYRQSGQALVRYVMLNRQCSEKVAYQRIATFVKSHVLLEEHRSIDRMLANDRQGLLDSARSILVHHPDEIDKI